MITPRFIEVMVLGMLVLLPPAKTGFAAVAFSDSIQASAHVSPHSIRIGESASIEIAVVTPPEHRVLPFASPTELQSIEIESVEELPIEMHPTRWTHRTRIRFRPRDTGRSVWPRTELAIETSDGTVENRILEPISVDVASTLHLFPGRSEPFGARPAPPRRRAENSLTFFALEIVITAAAVGFLALLLGHVVRRSRRKPAISIEKPWTLALNEIGNAAAIVDPSAAASAAASALRWYMEGRFGASTSTMTAEELAIATPPFGATSRWPTFTTLLLELDVVRFSPRGGDGPRSQARRRIVELLGRARAFVESSMPPEALR